MDLRIYGDYSYFWQWDLDRKLIVEDDGTCSQVHFYNGAGEAALVCLVKDVDGQRMADVPNILLQKAETVIAYLYTVAEDGTRTRSAHRFSVVPRARPEEYVYTETEVFNYAYLDERLKNLEGEGLAQAVADYLKENPVQAGATAEEAAQIEENRANIEQLATNKLDAAELPEAVNTALAQAKASGEFDGAPGKDGAPGPAGPAGADGQDGQNGSDYVLTEADKQEIAKQAAGMVDADVFTIVVDLDSMSADKTNEEIYAAYQEVRPSYMLVMGNDAPPYILQPVLVLPNVAVFAAHLETTSLVVRITDNVVSVEILELAKAEDIPENVSAFTNDAGYQTAAQVESIVEEAMKDIPAGGGGGATDPVEAWKDLASATIAKADAVAGTLVDTGLTFGDLKQYKEIIFRIGTPNSGPNLLDMRVLIKTNQAVDWYNYPFLFRVVNGVKSANIAKISFANSQKDIWSCVIGVGSAYDAFQNDLGTNNPFLTGNAAIPYELYGMQTYHKKSSAMTDSDPIQIYFYADAPADIRYKITGVFQ